MREKESDASVAHVRGGKWLKLPILVSEVEVPLWSSSEELLFRRRNQWFSSKVTTRPQLEVGEPELLFEGPYLNVNGYDYAYDSAAGRFLFLRSSEEDVREIRVISGWLEP